MAVSTTQSCGCKPHVCRVTQLQLQLLGDGWQHSSDWLQRPFLRNSWHIPVQDGDPKRQLKIPGWVQYQLYNRDDIDRILGKNRSWIISANDASIKNFGFLVSNRTYVYTIDDDCLPAEVVEAGATRKHQVSQP